MNTLRIGLLATSLTALLGIASAHAFTVTTNGVNSNDGASHLTDPDQVIQHFSGSPDSGGSSNTFKSGSTTFSFGFSGSPMGGGYSGNSYDGPGYSAMTGRQYFFGH